METLGSFQFLDKVWLERRIHEFVTSFMICESVVSHPAAPCFFIHIHAILKLSTLRFLRQTNHMVTCRGPLDTAASLLNQNYSRELARGTPQNQNVTRECVRRIREFPTWGLPLMFNLTIRSDATRRRGYLGNASGDAPPLGTREWGVGGEKVE